MTKPIRVTNLAPAGGFSLAVEFNDGTSGVADFSPILRGPLAALKDPKIFAHARADWGTICWPGDIDLAVEVVYALAHHLPPPTTMEEVASNELSVSLAEARRLSGKTQAQLAETSGIRQGDISKIERGDLDSRISTVRRYVEGLGGELEIVVRFGEKRLNLRGV
jgi:DNA-binding XRE family transcriptional regulator